MKKCKSIATPINVKLGTYNQSPLTLKENKTWKISFFEK